MMHPTIHLNGTGRQTLSREYGAAVEALRAALTALDELTVNGRDYYPQGPSAVQQAIEEHRARYRQVQAVYDDMHEIYQRLENS
jgi:hypothetical protein